MTINRKYPKKLNLLPLDSDQSISQGPPMLNTQAAQMNSPLHRLEQSLLPIRKQLFEHPLYRRLNQLSTLRCFMEHHIFAVWDFMSLLKGLQKTLSCVDIPWTPRGNTKIRRLILEIVLAEECDQFDDICMSHFELYLHAMRCCQADTRGIDALINQLESRQSFEVSIQSPHIPLPAQHFMQETWKFIHAKPHVLAAAFTFGREDLVPDLFRKILGDLNSRHSGILQPYLQYLDRHIQIDEDEHYPMALEMMFELCDNDPQKWMEAEWAAQQSLKARLQFWDQILAEVKRRESL